MPCLRQMSETVSPLARSRSASRSNRVISSAVHRLLYEVPPWANLPLFSFIGWTSFWGADQLIPLSPGGGISLPLPVPPLIREGAAEGGAGEENRDC